MKAITQRLTGLNEETPMLDILGCRFKEIKLRRSNP